MSFWDLEHSEHTLAAIQDDGLSITYGELKKACDTFAFANNFKDEDKKRSLGVVAGTNRISTLIAYLSALRSGHVVLPMNPALDKSLQHALIEKYKPDWLFHEDKIILNELSTSLNFLRKSDNFYSSNNTSLCSISFPDDLAVLMSTSGSTGSPKVARLSKNNVDSNAKSIVEYLNISSDDKPITVLPFYYSYGLSIVHSHLQAGATLCLTDQSILTPKFWDFANKEGITSISGVPYTYQMLKRIDLERRAPPTLKSLTQAGGKLSVDLINKFAQLSNKNGWKFFVMYGQTEASPRISYVPPEYILAKPDSIGISIPGGKLEIDPENNEIIYSGPNVMLGYAESRSDLYSHDELHGRLRTGDTGSVDNDGFFYINGRLKRFLKIYGNRINLDDIEIQLSTFLNEECAVVGQDDLLKVALLNNIAVSTAKNWFLEYAKIPLAAVKFFELQQIPRHTNGKINYVEVLENMEP